MRKFYPTPQTYAARPGAGFVSSLYNFTHDLGVEPHITRLFLECLIPDQGYPVGVIIPINQHSADQVGTGVPGSYYGTGFAVKATALGLTVSFDTNHGASIHQFDSKKLGRINNAAWRIIPRVYAP